ncbi:MAG: hypothetical protein AAFW98_16145 [Pseudomonadota bacterium]
MPFWWATGFTAAIVVVLVVAGLGLLILREARRIRRLALTAAQVVAEIDENTRSVWSLKTTNETAEALKDGAAAIEANARRIEDAVAGEHQRTAA